jgi:hypothetical protein
MTVETALIVAIIGLVGAVVAAVVTYHRSKLEEKRIQHEKQKWLVELHGELEKRLHEIRLNEYPTILAELERLSHFRIQSETAESLRELAAKLNVWGYAKAGLCMSGGTRDALFKLRFRLIEFTEGKLGPEELMAGPRTDLIEWLRRDVNHSVSTWRNLPTLLSETQAAAESSGEGKIESIIARSDS